MDVTIELSVTETLFSWSDWVAVVVGGWVGGGVLLHIEMTAVNGI